MSSTGRLRFYIYPAQQPDRTSIKYDLENTWAPPTDVYETEDYLVIKMSIAGIDTEDVRIRFLLDGIAIMGYRNFQKDASTIAYHQMEIRSGRFKRVIKTQIPLDSENTRVRYDKGLLKVSIPKKKKRHESKHAIKITF